MNLEQEPRTVHRPQPEAMASVPDEPYYRRGEQTRRWGALLLLVGVVWLVFAFAARGPFLPIGFVERSESLPAQSFDAERVVISGINDTIELVAGSGDAVVVEGSRHGFGWNGNAARDALESLELLIDEQGDTLRIEVRRPSFAAFGRAPHAELRIALPEGVAAEAELVSGDLLVEGVRGDLRLGTLSGEVETHDTVGELDVRTTSGDLFLNDHDGPLLVEATSGDVQASGDLDGVRVNSVSGDVELEGVRGTIELRSISGELTIDEAAEAELRIESTSGDVEFRGALARGGSNTISNISGDVQVWLIDPSDLRLDLRTTSGDLESDLPLQNRSEERRSLAGAIGEGGTELSVNTTSGDVGVNAE
jgi:hypothetical protein